MATKLFVGNIDYNATENELQDHFSRAGTVLSVNILQDKMTGKSRGFGFVEMSSEAEAQAAITKFHGADWEGRPMTVNEAKPMAPREGGGGGRGFGGGGGGRW